MMAAPTAAPKIQRECRAVNPGSRYKQLNASTMHSSRIMSVSANRASVKNIRSVISSRQAARAAGSECARQIQANNSTATAAPANNEGSRKASGDGPNLEKGMIFADSPAIQ